MILVRESYSKFPNLFNLWLGWSSRQASISVQETTLQRNSFKMAGAHRCFTALRIAGTPYPNTSVR